MKLLPWFILGLVCALALIIGVMYMSYSNQEVRLRNAITARQEANKATFDNMWKQIKQTAEVTDAQKNALLEIFIGHAKARSGSGDDKAVVKWLQESVPNVDVSVYKNLQNIIVAARNSFTTDQLALLDLQREHNNCLTMVPSSFFVGGRPPIKVTLVTSERTDAAFSAGKDDDVSVFSKPAPSKVEK